MMSTPNSGAQCTQVDVRYDIRATTQEMNGRSNNAFRVHHSLRVQLESAPTPSMLDTSLVKNHGIQDKETENSQ